MQIIIPISSLEEGYRYHNALLHLLAQIEIDTTNADLQQDLQTIYDLLRHLLPQHPSVCTYGNRN